MKCSSIAVWGVGLVLAAAFLTSCGGGDDAMPSMAPMAADAQLQGVVVAGTADGAKVYLDLNNNQSFDAGEPQATVSSDGSFNLPIGPRTTGELASAMLIAEVPQNARDGDDAGLTLQEAGRGPMHLMAPAAAFLEVDGRGKRKSARAVVSPLTTMVAGAVVFDGLTAPQAVETVRKQLGLGRRSPLEDYRASGDAVLGNIARAAAITLGQSPLSAEMPARPQIAMQAADLKTKMPAVIQELNLGSDRQARVSVAAVKQALAAVPQSTSVARVSAEALASSGTRFIVRFRDSVRDPGGRGKALAEGAGAQLRHSFARAVKGFAVTVPGDSVQAFIEAALGDPDVDQVEADQPVAITATQSNATWGLDRTDQRALPLSGTYTYTSTGKGVRAYIVDTGIMASHLDIRGRVASGFTVFRDGRGTNDCNGHGTHVAATVGGQTWGMAKGVTLVPVRVLDCSGLGLMSDVIAGIDWVTTNGVKPAVINMSLGGAVSASLNAAVANAVSAGFTMTVAAGNDSTNACTASPASEPSAITVAATTSTDMRATYSNYGTCVDVFAPGDLITSAGIASTTDTVVLSGTSMAAPHVAGLAVLYLQSNPLAAPGAVASAIKASASPGKVTDAGGGSPNVLVYTDLSSIPPPPDPGISDPDPGISDPNPGISDPNPGISDPVPPPPPPPPSVSVAALSASASGDSRSWRASVTIAVKNQSNALVPGVIVKGGFVVGGSKLSCTTASNGTCVINSGKIAVKTLTTRFSVESLTRSSPYNPNLNAATSVNIARP